MWLGSFCLDVVQFRITHNSIIFKIGTYGVPAELGLIETGGKEKRNRAKGKAFPQDDLPIHRYNSLSKVYS